MSALCGNRTSPRRVSVPLSLPKPRRVLQSSEFRTVYQTGVRMTSRYFAVFCLRLEAGLASAGELTRPTRFGFTVPRAVGKAVVRNRLKRRMREAVRVHMEQTSAGWAIVFNPRRSALDASFQDVCQEVGRILTRCKHS